MVAQCRCEQKTRTRFQGNYLFSSIGQSLIKGHHHEPDISPRYLNVNFKTGNTEIIKHTFAKIPLGKKCLFQQKDDTCQSV